MTGLADSHCHLDYFENSELENVLRRARDQGVGRFITIGTSVEQAETAKELAGRFPDVWCTVGVHPMRVAEAPLAEVAELMALADHPRVVGIGESGLDHFYDTAPRDVQAESFRRHVRAAQATGLPLVIHARQADADIARILREERDAGGPFAALLHCFSSGRALAEEVVEAGGYVSFSGILTFPKSAELRRVAADLPFDRLLVETDSPYLAPAPHRGKRCEPAYVRHTAAVLAEVCGVTPEELAERTTGNMLNLFKNIL